MRPPREEILRKLLHLFALLMPGGIYFLPKFGIPWYVPIIILAILFVGSVVVENLRRINPKVQEIFNKSVGLMLRKEEEEKITGSTWVIGSAFVCSIIFRNNAWIAFIALTLFVLGDAVAALVGMSIGKIKIGKKSLEGSTACFCLCMIFLCCVFPLIPGLIPLPGGRLPFYVSTATSLTITVFELIPLHITPKIVINDNLAVPIIAGLLLHLLTASFG